jgi:(heptosyl)LPS beta-1,4-glucosyltransferase
MARSIGIVFIVYNQSKLLENALKLIAGFKQKVFIFDLGSTEDIAKIAQKHGATYKRLPYTDIVETVRAKIFEQVTTDYILYLDGDESISTKLLTTLIEAASKNVDYVRIPRQNYIFGTWVQASRWWPDYQVRFFKKNTVTWPSTLHQQPVAKGEGLTLAEDRAFTIMHHNYQSMDEWLEKNRRYARLDAQSRLESQREFSITDAMQLSISELVSRYYSGHGYRDGMHGLFLAILQSFYYFLVYGYYWEGKKYQVIATESEIRSFPRKWFSHGLSEILYWDGFKANPVQKVKSKIVRKLVA